MRMRFKPVLATALLLTMASSTRARPVTVETLSGLVEKSDLLVVCEVTKIEDLRTEKSERWNAMITTRRATLRVIRGFATADGAAASPGELVVEYPALKADQPVVNGPQFPVLAEGELSLFPLKRVEGGWRFLSEEDVAMVMPAARRPIAAMPATPRDYLLHELAGALVNGDYQTMVRAGKYLNDLGTEVALPPQATKRPPVPLQPVADAVFGLIRDEIGESSLRLDTRWVQMGVASYMAAGEPLPAIADLLADDAPVRPPLQMARLALRKAGARDLDQRVMRLLLAHQEDPGAARGTVAAIMANYASSTDMLTLERFAISDEKPGAMAVADILVSDAGSPLAGTAALAARDLLDPKTKRFEQEINPEAGRHAAALLLRVGSDDDFAFFLDQIARAKDAAKPQYRRYLAVAYNQEKLPAPRLMALARLYIDDPSPLQPPGDANAWRVSDAAAVLVGRVAQDDFGVKPGAMKELRDAGIERAKKYLGSKQ